MPNQVHLLSDEKLKLIGYRLLCSIYAEYEWHDLRRDDDPDILDSFLASADEEISEMLLTLAALARAADDSIGTLGQLETVFPNGCGTLENSDDVKTLNLREACNKIIHAQSLTWDFSISEENPLYNAYYISQGLTIKGNFKNPIVQVTGDRHGKPWVAKIRIVPFIVAISNWDVAQWKFG